ncbi:MAG: hypothetical protein H6838_09955 [Planctomycetes bacterium]|nr:hypothetical protein [Planctomycetota bacterium]MCB9885807.1 hypothetical protein [Planctomycetota bacterium]
MKNRALPLLCLLLAGTCPPPQDGVTWQTSIEAATRLAAREGKGVLVLQLFGRFDETLC